MKTRMNQLVVVALLALLVFGGNASAKGIELNASGRENVKESALLVEDWMVDASYWNVTNANAGITDAMDDSMELESWMTDENIWKADRSIVSEKVAEKVLTIEPWMVSENVWK